MKPLVWTTNRPDHEHDAHYWLRRPGRPPGIVIIHDDTGRPVVITPYETAYLDTIEGEWAGPIPQPVEHDDPRTSGFLPVQP